MVPTQPRLLRTWPAPWGRRGSSMRPGGSCRWGGAPPQVQAMPHAACSGQAGGRAGGRADPRWRRTAALCGCCHPCLIGACTGCCTLQCIPIPLGASLKARHIVRILTHAPPALICHPAQRALDARQEHVGGRHPVVAVTLRKMAELELEASARAAGVAGGAGQGAAAGEAALRALQLAEQARDVAQQVGWGGSGGVGDMGGAAMRPWR